METITTEIQRYPIGRFSRPEGYSAIAVAKAIAILEGLPRKLLANVSNFSPADWNRRYRPGSWTIHQLANHIVDANINNYTRFKFALTEDNPVIMPYLEDLWSDLPDAKNGDMHPSLDLLNALHAKWVQSLRTMSEADFGRSFFHPKMDRSVPLYEAIAMYAWHSEHHLAQIRLAITNPV